MQRRCVDILNNLAAVATGMKHKHVSLIRTVVISALLETSHIMSAKFASEIILMQNRTFADYKNITLIILPLRNISKMMFHQQTDVTV